MSDKPPIVLDEQDLHHFVPDLDRFDTVALDRPEDAGRLAGRRVLVTGGGTPIGVSTLDRMPALGLIACFAAGYDAIDLAAARARGIAVTHAVDANHEDVADFAIGLTIAHRRRIADFERGVRDGRWAETRAPTRSLTGARLGIVGLGAIGAAVARRGAAMRMDVAWWGPRAKPDAGWPRADSVVALATWSDVLVIAAAAYGGNDAMISADVIAALGPGGLLVNVARGRLVDEDALIAALRSGAVGGAALDVFAHEPTPPERWQGVPNTLLTTHVGGATDEAVAEMGRQCIANVDAFLAGRPLLSPVA